MQTKSVEKQIHLNYMQTSQKSYKRSHQDLENHLKETELEIADEKCYAPTDAGLNFMIGGVSGITAKTCIAPIDRQKIIFQTSSRRFSFKALFKQLKITVLTTGYSSLWRGHSLTLLRTFPYSGIQFMAHDFYKHLFLLGQKEYVQVFSLDKSGSLTKELSPVSRFLSGACAGTTSTVCVYPLELLRTRMAVQKAGVGDHSKGIKFNINLLTTEHGFRGFYLGLKPALVGMVPYAGTAFGTFETLKSMSLKRNNKTELDHWERVLFGASAGWLAQTITYPLDVVRRRMQTEGADVADLSKCRHMQRRYTGILSTLKLVFFEEGYRGLFKGVSLNWIKGPIALGISFSTFDFLKTNIMTNNLDNSSLR
eukprot:snap_masked-scaffold_6-processed-gene-15.57-mRNA-1 protein AED:0.02 eAED:0.02 QI:0/-1/0/1/-1/1/1/0/366